MLLDVNMKVLEKECNFLIKKGFRKDRKESDSRFIVYVRNSVEISIGAEPGDGVNIFIKFTGVKTTYDVAWIGTARDHKNFDAPSQTEQAVLLIAYLRDNFDNLTSQSYCEESREYITQWIAENRALLDKARNDFINWIRENKRYKNLRNFIIIAGIVIAFVIWLFIPDTFKNSPLFHVGNGEYGSKWGALILLPIPLFSLCFRKSKTEFHGSDKEYATHEQNAADKTNMLLGMVTAIALSLLVIGLMSAALFLL